MLNAREGQTYICTKSDKPWWTTGKEYKVVVNKYDELCFVDDDGAKWSILYLKNHGYQFKLKENTFDLNKLTTAQLREYTGLLEDKEESELLLNEFIERMTK